MPILGFNNLAQEQEASLLRSIVENRPTTAPTSIELQPTNKCNVDCFFCSSKPFRNDEFLPWSKLEREIRDAAAKGLRFIRLSGGGESLIYPDLRALLDLMIELGLRLSDVTTNATALRPVAEKLVETGLDDASISLNEPDAELWAKTMRAPARLFDRCLEGIEQLVAARDASPGGAKTRIQLKFMVHRGNYLKMPLMYELGRRFKADQVMLNEIGGLEESQRMTPPEIEEAKELLRAIIREDCATGEPLLSFNLGAEGDLQDFAMREAVALRPEHYAPHPPEKDRIHYCMMGWYHTTVAATGVVYPCCNFVGLPNKDVGNLHEQSLSEIWHGDAYARYRREFRELMLLGGSMEWSARAHRYMSPYCAAETACPFSWGLCSHSFYQRVRNTMREETPANERLVAAGKNSAIKAAHGLKNLVRK